MANTLNWFEIPTTDLTRASTFYEKVLGVELRREDFGGTPMAIFAARDPDLAGALVKDARRKPSSDGALLYLNVNGRLDAVVDRIAKAGGEVLVPKMDIGEPGFIALFRDTEGNVVGLHSERAR
jgi:predicted enzyme related to lactoylglutathione lyase